MVSSPDSGSRAWPAKWGEALGLLGLAALTAFLLATSWRKWPEPLIDFGRELYLPWRLSNGAVLYRDADDFYGPLSQYFNAGLFRILGPGLMTLAAANLALFAVIVTLTYLLFRRAWGVGAAMVSSAVFVAVFGFSVFYGGNYNFVTPYSHEATHGFLVCLILVAVLARWLESPTATCAAAAGFLFGLTAVLKPEIMLSAGLATCAAILLGRMRSRLPPVTQGCAWAGAAALPTVVFWAYFSAHVPTLRALGFASRAWINIATTTRFTSDPIQAAFLGFDEPWTHLVEHGTATLVAIALVGGLAVVAVLMDRIARAQARIATGVVLSGAIVWLALAWIDWLHVGRCLLGLAIIYIAFGIVSIMRRHDSGEDAARPALRFLIAVLAAAMMSRMLLNGRVIHFGFYQAALACILVPAVLIGELPQWIGLGGRGRAALIALAVAVSAAGTTRLVVQSQDTLRKKTFEVGKGVDRFYSYPPEIEPTGELVGLVSDELRDMPGNQTLVVLPEGEMINYLARRPSPVAPFFFFSAVTRGDLEQDIVNDLQKHPPDWIVIISRSLRDYGIEHYGKRPGEGREILEWASSNYRIVSSIGGDPFESDQRGALILSR
jgi:hypothetical protein